MSIPSIEVLTHVILFVDESQKWITDAQAQMIWKHSADRQYKGVKIGESWITFSSISKLLTRQDFYEQYPGARPEPQLKLFDAPADPRPETSEEQAMRGEMQQNGLIRGLQQFIDEQAALGIDTPNAKMMMEHWKQKQAWCSNPKT